MPPNPDADGAAIVDVLTRYATGIDFKDWALFRSCWTDEVDLDYGEVGHFTDPDAFTELFAQVHNPMGPTYHRLSNFVVATDGDAATARTYVHAVLMVTPGDNAGWVDVVGHYDDELVRGADGWRIRRRVTHTSRMLTGGDFAGADKGVQT
jgi:SnoaL-like domain